MEQMSSSADHVVLIVNSALKSINDVRDHMMSHGIT